MKIKDRLRDGKVHISFEVFPPKTDAKFESVQNAVDEIANTDTDWHDKPLEPQVMKRVYIK